MLKKRKQLKKWQNTATNFVVATPRCALFIPMGMGKTVIVLTVIDFLKTMGEVRRKVLVIAPLRVAKSTWPREVKDWDHLRHLRVSVICGTERERAEAMKVKADIYTINYENLPWLEERLKGKWPFDVVVADESTKLKGFRTKQGTKRSKVLGRYAHEHTKRFIQLTGTPAPNGLKDLWALGWFIDQGVRLGRNYTAFLNRWFRRDFSGFNWDPMPHSQKEIEDKLKDVCYSLSGDLVTKEEPIAKPIVVDLPPEAKKLYKDMEKQMFIELEDALGTKTIEAVNAASRTMKCLQLANGAIYTEEGNRKWEEIHDQKIKALEEIVEEAMGTPVLVAYHFRSDLARLKAAFPSGRQLDTNPKTEDDWNAGKIPVLFAHPASCGHGLNLQVGGNILAFFSLNWNLEEHQQIIERIGPRRQKMAGLNRPVFVYYIMARGTVDGIVRARLQGKAEVQDLLMKAMKGETFDDQYEN